MDIDEELKRNLIELIREGKPIPLSYKTLLFPMEEKIQEIELVYGAKERREDILGDTMSIPFQAVKKFGNVKEGEWHNKLIFGDNLQALKFMLKDPEIRGKVKLIYIDPPFATRQELKGNKDELAYADKIAGAEFLEFLRRRLVLIYDLLADNGSLYIHLDKRKGHYAKVLLDEIFGEHLFQSEIIWKRTTSRAGSNGPNHIHDTIFMYTKSPDYTWNVQYTSYSEKYIKGQFRYKDEIGRYRKVPITGAGTRKGQSGMTWKGYDITKAGSHWAIPGWLRGTLSNKAQNDVLIALDELDSMGRITFTSEGKPELKAYLNEKEGVELQSIWVDVANVRNPIYPTQKPEKLLEKIIFSSSNEGDIVMDCFAGSGTTGAVAEKLGRKWIMVDSSKLAIYTMVRRMLNLKEEIGNKGKPLKPKPFVLYNAGLYEDHGFILNIGEEKYKKFAMELFQVEPKDFEINGMKMDGVLFNCPVKVFSQQHFLTEEYINDLHDVVGEYLNARMFVIAPASRVYFLQDYIEKNGLRYYILRIPYSIIDELHKQKFTRPMQPASSEDINKLIDAVGFDFIHPPHVKANYYSLNPRDKLVGQELIIEIEDFKAEQRAKEPIEFNDQKDALSIIMIDKDYNGSYFNLTDFFFKDQIEKENWKVRIPVEGIGKKIMIIYLDVLGNEAIEVKSIEGFRDR